MKAYIAPDGFNILAAAQTNAAVNSLSLTGYTIGSNSNFVPDNTMLTTQGTTLVNKSTSPKDVLITPLHPHEIIISVRLDQNLKFSAVGNILIYLNNKPFLWSISNRPLPKEDTDSVAHYAGDEYFFPIVFRYPFISTLIKQELNTYYVGHFPRFDNINNITVPGHTLCEQIQIDTNDFIYGNDKPVIANRIGNHWLGTPLFENLSNKLSYIDGGKTKTGL